MDVGEKMCVGREVILWRDGILSFRVAVLKGKKIAKKYDGENTLYSGLI